MASKSWKTICVRLNKTQTNHFLSIIATIFISGLLLFSSYRVFLRSYILDLIRVRKVRNGTRDDIHKNIYAKKELLIFLEKLQCFSRSKLRCKESKKKNLF